MTAIETELQRAENARAEGNEGMARVCARRAAGLAVAAYLAKYPHSNWGTSAIDRLAGLSGDDTIPTAIRGAASRLTARITTDHVLPSPEDPIEDARLVISYVNSQTT